MKVKNKILVLLLLLGCEENAPTVTKEPDFDLDKTTITVSYKGDTLTETIHGIGFFQGFEIRQATREMKDSLINKHKGE